jgi:amino acid permease
VASDDFDLLFDRDEVLAGLPNKRADTLLFLIETRTAHLMARARRDAQPFVTERTARERELAFIEAFALEREPPLQPTIQDLERYSEQWSPLVPDNPRIRAAIAHRLGERYRVAHASASGLRAALGLDTAEVRQAHRRLYGASLKTIFATRLGILDRLRWRWSALVAWLDGLSPFWTSFALTLTETVGATILALPIALAAVGPLGGAAVLIVIGLLNVVTVAFMAEAVARSGRVRHGGAVYVGGVVQDYLGRIGSLILSVSLFVLLVLILPAFYIGVASTLQESVGLPAPIGAAALIIVGLFYLRRESLNATVSSALVVGAINIALVVVFCFLAAGHLQSGNLTFEVTPFLRGDGFDIAALGLVFGVVMAGYFGHTSVVLCGRLVLNRDPSGRSLLRGCVAAQATAMLLYCLFVVAVNGAVDPAALAAEAGTVLVPLADEVGPAVLVLGSVFVILGMGMGTIHFSLAIFNLVRERLPAEARDSRFLDLGVSLARVLEMNDERASVVTWMTREGEVDIDEVAEHTGLSKPEARDMLRSLVHDGLVSESDVASAPRYSVVLARRRPRVLPREIWAALEIEPSAIGPVVERRWWRGPLQRLGARGRFALSAGPVVLVFLATEWMLLTESGSFAGLLSFVGVIVVTLLTGIFPVLLLVSSRQKGERSPARVYSFLSHPVVLAVLYLFFLSSVVLHGLVIWDDLWERAGAVIVSAMILATTGAMKRRGAFTRRVTVEVRTDAEGGRTLFEISVRGRPLRSLVQLDYRDGSKTLRAAAGEIPRFSSLSRAVFKLNESTGSGPAQEVKVWVHRSIGEAESLPIHAVLRIRTNGNVLERDLELSGGQAVLPLGADDEIELVFAEDGSVDRLRSGSM